MIFNNYVWENSNFKNAHRYLIDNIVSNLPDKNSIILDYGFGNGVIYNYIISTEVIEHVYNPIDYFSFFQKILLKNGSRKVLITTPYHVYFKNIIISLFGSNR